MVKILHTADFHLDAARSSLKDPGLASRLREELRSIFLRVLEIAVSNNVDIVLIAGDLFDGENVLRSTVSLVKDGFSKAPGIRFFIAPGNHDPLLPGSAYLSCDWPENVHIFGSEMEKVELPQLGVNVWGAGFMQGEQWQNRLSGFKADDSEKINIMVLHGELSAPGGVTPYGPITVGDIAKSGLDYVALGHIHKACLPQRAKDSFFAYSGSPQGQGFDETGEKGVLIGTVGKRDVNLSFVQTAKRRYEIVRVNVEGAATTAQAAQKIRGAAGDLLSQHLVRAVLCGEVPAEVTLALSLIEKELDDAFYIEIEDKTSLSRDFEALAREQTLQGLFVAKLLQKMEEAGDDIHARRTAELALKLGLAAMADEEVQAW